MAPAADAVVFAGPTLALVDELRRAGAPRPLTLDGVIASAWLGAAPAPLARARPGIGDGEQQRHEAERHVRVVEPARARRADREYETTVAIKLVRPALETRHAVVDRAPRREDQHGHVVAATAHLGHGVALGAGGNPARRAALAAGDDSLTAWRVIEQQRSHWTVFDGVARALRMLRNKVDKLPRKKHGNIPL